MLTRSTDEVKLISLTRVSYCELNKREQLEEKVHIKQCEGNISDQLGSYHFFT